MRLTIVNRAIEHDRFFIGFLIDLVSSKKRASAKPCFSDSPFQKVKRLAFMRGRLTSPESQ